MPHNHHRHHLQDCQTTYEQECSTVNEQQCSTVNEQQCSTVNEQQCSQTFEQECTTVSEQQCNTVEEEVSQSGLWRNSSNERLNINTGLRAYSDTGCSDTRLKLKELAYSNVPTLQWKCLDTVTLCL